MKNIKLGLDLAGGVSITYQVKDDNPSDEEMSDTIYKLQKRVEQYSTEASVYQEGSDRINIEIPGVTDANEILDELGQPGSLYFIAQTGSDGSANYSQVNSTGDASKDYQLNKTIEELQADGSIVLSGNDVKSAQAQTTEDQLTKNKQNVVSLTFTKDGTTKFADATTKALAASQSIGIYYDGAFVSVPNVQAAITNGQAQISGNMTYEEADALASTIRIGGLKLELEELRSNVVGAQLGEQAVATSLKAGAIGLAINSIVSSRACSLIGSTIPLVPKTEIPPSIPSLGLNVFFASSTPCGMDISILIPPSYPYISHASSTSLKIICLGTRLIAAFPTG